MQIDPSTGYVVLPHTSHSIAPGMTSQEMYELGILKGNYNLRDEEVLDVIISNQPARLGLQFIKGVFYEARIYVRSGTHTFLKQALLDLKLDSIPGLIAEIRHGDPRDGEMWLSISYFNNT